MILMLLSSSLRAMSDEKVTTWNPSARSCRKFDAGSSKLVDFSRPIIQLKSLALNCSDHQTPAFYVFCSDTVT